MCFASSTPPLARFSNLRILVSARRWKDGRPLAVVALGLVRMALGLALVALGLPAIPQPAQPSAGAPLA